MPEELGYIESSGVCPNHSGVHLIHSGVRAASDVVAFAAEVLVKNAEEWGIRVADEAPLHLSGTLLRFMVNESNKPADARDDIGTRSRNALSFSG